MKKLFSLIIFTACWFFSYSQMYILNEDFGGAAGTTPPAGWSNTVVTGVATDLWHFDNPGMQEVLYPVTEPFAIFDAEAISANGSPESSSLETPIFDASLSNFILLNFHHRFEPGNGGQGRVEAYDGSAWQLIATFTNATQNPESAILDLSPVVGGITNARLRFTWSGNGSGFWALDNIRIYASQPLDGGMVSIDDPTTPVIPGVQNVVVTIGNFGYNTISTATINWTANGVAQPPHTWNGSAGFGQTVGGVVIGSYNFQDAVLLKVWVSNPNGQPDPNPFNDTITKYVQAALCGTYTIGGANPDYGTFGEAADALNQAGVTCPVTFLVRDGTYSEQFILRDISGTSPASTVTFRSESGDSTKAVIKIIPTAQKYEPMIFLDGSKYIRFENLGFSTGSTVSYANSAVLTEGAQDIAFNGCYFDVRNQFDYALTITEGSTDILAEGNRFRSYSGRAGAVKITGAETRQIGISANRIKGPSEWGYSAIWIDEGADNVAVEENRIDSCYQAVYLKNSELVRVSGNIITHINDGIYVDDYCTDIMVSGNRITELESNPNVAEGNSGITIDRTTGAAVFNNFIHTTGDKLAKGIYLVEAGECVVSFNSVNITNTDVQSRSLGLLVRKSTGTITRNNIFNVKYRGTPVSLVENVAVPDMDRNDYYSFDGSIGYFQNTRYFDLAAWQAATSADAGSFSVTPFFNSDTDLSINQAVLNNSGVPVAGITVDIDGTTRNPSAPDIGAREYTPCASDAGINAVVNPENPLAGGTEEVIVLLQNQGSSPLTSARIDWQVNGAPQPQFQWNGNLAAGASAPVSLGSFNFASGSLYTIRSWTSQPNGTSDCNHRNDTITSPQLAAPLCGTYTIGGTDPDFDNFIEVVEVLNQAGVTCPVTFLVRDGVYEEQFVLGVIPGASATNAVTFRSESGDSSKAILKIRPEAQKFETMITLQGTAHLSFREIGFISGPQLAFNNNIFHLSAASDIVFEQCYFEPRRSSDQALVIENASHDLLIANNRFNCKDPRSFAINLTGAQTRDINITGNIIKGTTDWNYPTVRIGTSAASVNVTGNLLDSCFRAIQVIDADSVLIAGNLVTRSNEAVYLDNFCTQVTVSGNRFITMFSHPNSTDGATVISTHNVSNCSIFNNYIHSAGSGPSIGISLEQSNNCQVVFNSLNITNEENQGKSTGLHVYLGNGIIIKNNISNISRLGTPVFIEEMPVNADINFNDYFSPRGVIGNYNGNTYSSLNTWSDSTGADLNSVSANPFYSGETELAPNQVLVNNAGTPVAGITADIDGTIRNMSAPDMGAKEYNPCSTDAGINRITNPNSPLALGPEEIRVELINQGTSTLTSARVNWSVNGEVQSPFNWSGSLAPGQGELVAAGNYTFVSGVIYTITAWTSEPNGTADCNAKNDTTRSLELAAPLCGTYTIGGITPDFISVGQAATVLNEAGITCPVVMLVRDGLYEEMVVLGDISGSSDDNTVTFRSESGDSSLAVLQLSPTALRQDALILLEGSRNIIFEDLGFITGGQAGGANPVILMKGAENIRVGNCSFETKKESDFSVVAQEGTQNVLVENSRMVCTHNQGAAINITDAGTSNIAIKNSYIRGNALGGNSLIRIRNDARRIEISGNRIENSFRTLYAVGVDSLKIHGNTIRNTNDGIIIDDGCSNVEISANAITRVNSHQNSPNGTSGIAVIKCTGLELINNFVQTQGQGPVIAINLQNDSACRVIYNSVNVTNTDLQAKSKGIYVNDIKGFYSRNNLWSVKTDGLPIHIDQDVTGISFDYNNYFHPAGIIGNIEGQNYNSLSAWGQEVNGDANSKVVNPYYKADTIPLPFQRALNGAGIPINGILFDIEGKLRFSQAPDIGCFEFYVDYGVLELLSPTLNCYHPDVDSVIVYIRQFGDLPFADLKVAYQLDNGPVHLDTIPGPLLEDVVHTFGTTENISTFGDYRFKIWLINTLDDNINNDTLIAMRYSKPPPEVTLGYDNFCTGWTVNFTGSATVAAPYFIESYEWLFGDGETSDEQNPVHSYDTSGTYEVILRAYSNAGCYSETITQIMLDPDFQGISLGYNAFGETCLGDNTGYIELNPYGGYPPYQVFVNEQLVNGTVATGLTTGTYILRTVDSQNCSRTDTVELASEILLNPQITAAPLSGMAPLTVDFAFTANDPATWMWHFTETDSSMAEAPTFTFETYGNHQVVLEVMSGHPHYCIETAVIDIFVDIVVSFDANNVFTPNNDGYNDFFEVVTTGVDALTVNIFNAWGNKVYVIEEVGGRWDGTTEGGTEVPDGTYFWHLEARGMDYKDYEYQGSVLLLRHAAAAYPNPARESAELEVFGQLEIPAEISVYTMMGQLVYSKTVNDREKLTVELSGLDNGIYLVRVNDRSRNYSVRLIKF